MPVILTGLCAEFNPCFRLLFTKGQSNIGPKRLSFTAAIQKEDYILVDHPTSKNVLDLLEHRNVLIEALISFDI